MSGQDAPKQNESRKAKPVEPADLTPAKLNERLKLVTETMEKRRRESAQKIHVRK